MSTTNELGERVAIVGAVERPFGPEGTNRRSDEHERDEPRPVAGAGDLHPPPQPADGGVDRRERVDQLASAVVGSMIVATRRTSLHGNPPPLACSCTVASSSAM